MLIDAVLLCSGLVGRVQSLDTMWNSCWGHQSRQRDVAPFIFDLLSFLSFILDAVLICSGLVGGAVSWYNLKLIARSKADKPARRRFRIHYLSNSTKITTNTETAMLSTRHFPVIVDETPGDALCIYFYNSRTISMSKIFTPTCAICSDEACGR